MGDDGWQERLEKVCEISATGGRKKLHLTSNPAHIIVWVEQRTLMAVAKKEIVRANDEKMLNNMMFFFLLKGL
jgi:hypothetical protein